MISLPVLHPILLSAFLMFFQDFVGYYAVIFNGEEIFEEAGVTMPTPGPFTLVGIISEVINHGKAPHPIENPPM